jgi:hypothetical protein
MAGDVKRQEHAADDDSSDEEGECGKGDGAANKGSGGQRGQEQHGPLPRQQGWHATKRAMAMAARAMGTRVPSKRWQHG